jgi:hypothetical protein
VQSIVFVGQAYPINIVPKTPEEISPQANELIQRDHIKDDFLLPFSALSGDSEKLLFYVH